MSLTTLAEKEELQNLILDKLCDKIEGYEKNAEEAEEEEKSINSVSTKLHILIVEWKEMFHWITRQQVESRLIRRKNENEKGGTATTPATTPAAAAAAAQLEREQEEAENDNNNNNNNKASATLAQNVVGNAVTTTAFNNDNNVGQQPKLSSPPEQVPEQNLPTTKTTSRKQTLKKNPVQPLDIRKKIYKLKDEITADYGWLKGLNSKKKLAKGTLEKLIEKKKKEYGLENVEIKAETIRTRWKNSKVGVQVQHGNISPLEGIEPMIIDQIRKRKLQDQNNPMKKKDIIQCANIILLQQQNNNNNDPSSSVVVISDSNNGKGKGKIKENNVGNGWYENFRVRWQPELLELGYEPKQKRSKKTTLQQQQQQQT